MSTGQVIVISIFLVLLAVWGIWRIYKYVTRVNRRLRLLLDAVEAGDTSLRFPATSDDDVNIALNRIAQRLSMLKREAVEQDRFYELILNDISTGVMVYDSRGYVEVHNPALLALLSRSVVTNIDSLKSSHLPLVEFLTRAKGGDSFRYGSLSVKVATFTTHNGIVLRIATFDDISSQLEGKSVEAWQDMSRVLTHEIMNGIAPVLSVADSLRIRYKGNEEYIFSGLRVISESCEGLKNFVERYNRVTRVAPAAPESFDVVALIDGCIELVRNINQESQTAITFTVSAENLNVFADRGQIQQVVVNLLKNAMETDATLIKVSCYHMNSRYVMVTVEDNGSPIPEEISELIFTPFFTTKPTGSGIGLSLSRRLVIGNRGTLTLSPEADTTKFVMTLPS
ncbi:MAG: ATP-binding protein [Duncaniella sp.]|nr:ATP-binding protein [Muribaculum sp.]MCM1255432.1 ATP-binding protein [Duncaniella sp.]